MAIRLIRVIRVPFWTNSQVTDLMLSLALITCLTAPAAEPVSRLAVIQPAPEFSLTSEHRHTFTNRELNGKVTIADFVFTTCAGPCPLMSAEMQRLQGELSSRQLAQFVLRVGDNRPQLVRNALHDRRRGG